MEEHACRLEILFGRLINSKLPWNRVKRTSGIPKASAMGHRAGTEDIHMSRDKARAIAKAPHRTPSGDLKRSWDLSFYVRYLKKRARVARHLYECLWKDVALTWEERLQ